MEERELMSGMLVIENSVIPFPYSLLPSPAAAMNSETL
jgi:hypothetical protein